jgi:hypothetical protein
VKFRDDIQSGTNLGGEDDEAVRLIFAMVEANDFAGAERQGDEEYLRLSEKAEQLQAARGSLVESNLSVARMAYDSDRMARWALEHRRLAEGGEQLTLAQIRQEWEVWFEGAQRSGVKLDMYVAIALARHSIEQANTSLDWSVCQNDLALALRIQGERLGGDTGLLLLGEAVAVCRTALGAQAGIETLGQSAMTQNNLGLALQTLGTRLGWACTAGRGGGGLSLGAEGNDPHRDASAMGHDGRQSCDRAANPRRVDWWGSWAFAAGGGSGGFA